MDRDVSPPPSPTAGAPVAGQGRRPPTRAILELTYRCDLRCAHCLVDAGGGGGDELDAAEMLEAVDQLAELGARVVTVTGGEPLLRRDWFDVATRIRERGMVFRLSTNGHLLDAAVLARLEEIGTQRVVVSVDGTREVHDRVRSGLGRRGKDSSFDLVMACLDRLRESTVVSSVITAVTRLNLGQLPAIQALLKERGVQRWTVQLAHASGRLRGPGRDGAPSSLLLVPEQLEELAAFLEGAAADPALPPIVFNSIGYLSREEPIIRPSGRDRSFPFWTGCQCGIRTVGIEPDGGVKGCANQVGDPFVVGNLRKGPLREIWDDEARWHWLRPRPEQLRGTCADCKLAPVCGAGCTALAFASSGELFDNPFCLRAVRREGGGE
jgi:radical SAM protein with 4Fe4S-binding SPASM domain